MHLHDRQELMDLLTTHREDTSIAPDHLTLSLHVLEGELRDYHARYLARRPLLTEAVTAMDALVARNPTSGRAAAVGGAALALSGLLYARHRRAG